MSLSSTGLIASAILAVLLALGEVCNKKVVEGQEVIAAVFWIRFFALIEFTLVLIAFSWAGSPPFIHAPAALNPGDFTNIPALAADLRSPSNPAIRRIEQGLSASTREQLAAYQPGVRDAALAQSLAADLDGSHVLGGGNLYNRHDFAATKLSPETQSALARSPRGDGRAYANRLLLEDLFPGTIAPDRTVALFGLKSAMVPPLLAFLTYLLIEVILVAASQSLFSYALKISPISLSVPFSTFGPIFTLGTGYLVLGELPSMVQMMGISLLVLGGVLMYQKLFAVGWTAPIQAIVHDRGSRYILLATLIGSVYSPIEKQMILMSDPLTTAFGYGIGTAVAFFFLCRVRGVKFMPVIRQKPVWAVLSGLSDANTMFAQFIAVMYLPVVIVICIKRGGIVLTVLAGWLIFREQDITQRLIAAFAMMGGIAIFYLPLHFWQSVVFTAVIVVGVVIATYLCRNTGSKHTLTEEAILD